MVFIRAALIASILPWANHFRPTAKGGDPPASSAVTNKTDDDCLVSNDKFFAYIDPYVWHHFTILREEIWHEVYLDEDSDLIYESQLNCNSKNAYSGFSSSEGNINKFDNLVIIPASQTSNSQRGDGGGG